MTVLVLEAGPANLNDPDICEQTVILSLHAFSSQSTSLAVRPASYASHFSNDRYAWAHMTVCPQPRPCALKALTHRRTSTGEAEKYE